MSLTYSLGLFARQRPDAPAMLGPDGPCSWGQLEARVSRFAAVLRDHGLAQGDRVALLGRNSSGYVEALFSVFWAGAVIVPLNLRWTPEELSAAIADCDARLLLVDPGQEALGRRLAELRPGLRLILMPDASAIGLSVANDNTTGVQDAQRTEDDLAAILYTGGTTGRSKGVMLTHGNLAASALGALACPGMEVGPRYLHSAPLSHVGGLSGLLMAMFSGSANVFLASFEPANVVAAIDAYAITDAFLVPTMLQMMLDAPGFYARALPSLRRIRYGASPISPTVLDRLMTLFPDLGLSQAYGMTELAPVATILTPADHRLKGERSKLATAGRATPVTEICIADQEGGGAPTGDIGEILVRGPNMMLGYWNLPQETAQALRGGWMHTGDLGFLDREGYLTVVDRLKDMIVSGGENIYSVEVENVLATHPAVEAVGVVGTPDPIWGETVVAFVVLRSGAAQTQDLREYCRGRLAAYKLPRHVVALKALPLTPAGKIAKVELRARARTLFASPDAATP